VLVARAVRPASQLHSQDGTMSADTIYRPAPGRRVHLQPLGEGEQQACWFDLRLWEEIKWYVLAPGRPPFVRDSANGE